MFKCILTRELHFIKYDGINKTPAFSDIEQQSSDKYRKLTQTTKYLKMQAYNYQSLFMKNINQTVCCRKD